MFENPSTLTEVLGNGKVVAVHLLSLVVQSGSGVMKSMLHFSRGIAVTES